MCERLEGNIQIIMAISLMLRRFVNGLPIQILVEDCQLSGASQSQPLSPSTGKKLKKVQAVDVDRLFYWNVLSFAVHVCHGQRLQIA